MSSALDLWTLKSIGNIFLPWIVYKCDMVTLGGKDNGLLQIPVCLTFNLLTSKLKGNIFLSWVDHMCDMVTLGGKDNGLEPGNHISTLMSSALDL